MTQANNLARGTIRRIPAEKLHLSKPVWWLESRFHFSFADYFNPANMNFGALRVVNDDLVQSKAGFGSHPHRDAEIFSYIVDGELSHADSMGNKESLPRGCVQYLSAGTGITHSEMNDGDKRCRFLQIWLTPNKVGHKPQYGSSQYKLEDRHNKLLQILGGVGSKVPQWECINRVQHINLNQDANVFVSESDAGTLFSVSLQPGRQAYMVCIEGSVGVNGSQLQLRDGMEIVVQGEQAFAVTITVGPRGAHFILIEMAQNNI